MTDEKRFSSNGLLRVNVEFDTRDVTAVWTDAEEIVVHGSNIDATVEAAELFITSDNGRRNNPGPVHLDLPVKLIGCEFKLDRGDIRLSDARGKVDIKLDGGDITVQEGTGSLSIASGKGDAQVDRYSGEVIANSGSGDTSLRNVDGSVTVRSGKGDVNVAGGRGMTTIAVGSGDIQVKERDCDEVTVAGASGDITIVGGRIGRGAISAASGDIRCHAQLTLADYEFTVSSGDVSVSVPRGLAARVDAATSRGNITTDLPLVVINQRGPRNPHGKRVVGSTSDAPERAEITLRTSRGDIDVRWSASSSPVATAPVTTVSPEPSPAAADPPPVEPAGVATSTPLSDEDRRRAILAALADGSITVEEAGMLLDAIDRAHPDESGVS